MLNAFTEFAIIVLLAASLGFIAVKFRQPPILGYIFTGLIVSFLTPFFKPDAANLELLSKVGVTLLLFTLGLELKVSELRKLGKVSLATGIGQIVFTSIIGFVISVLLGFDSITSAFIAIGLTFSSTIVIVKLLNTKNQIDTLFGKISVGFLLVQDFIAILILIGLSAVKNVDGGSLNAILMSFLEAGLKGIVAAAVIYVLVKFVLYPVLDSLKTEKEVLFLLTIAWALICAAVLYQIGFTVEVGGLAAGIALANRFEQLQIESWTRPLRDFFLALFFVILGTHIQIDTISSAIFPTIIFSIFVLIGNPLIVMVIMGFLGYKKKTSFLTSLSVAQISEFSLLVINFAYLELGQVNSLVLTIMTLVGGLTMTVSSYMIYYNEQLYEKLAPYLGIFEIKKVIEEGFDDDNRLKKTIVLFGCKRTGKNLLKLVKAQKEDILVIDFDPRVIRELREDGYEALYADMGDEEMYKYFNLDHAEIVVSTIPSLHENKILLRYISDLSRKPISIITANDGDSSSKLYDMGADFVVYPHLLSGEIISKLLKRKKLTKSFVQRRTHNIENLPHLT